MKLLNLLVIGSYSRNAGKTTFTQKVIKAMNGNITAFKVTVIKDDRLVCPRGGTGCGVCTSLETDFEISEERDSCSGKDTSKLLEAGAEKVYWLRVKESAVLKGMKELMKKIDPEKPVVCESNSLMKYITPSLFFILKAKNEESKKKFRSIC